MNYTQPIETDQQKEPVLEIWRRQKEQEQAAVSSDTQDPSDTANHVDQSHVH
jgi:hypothetical protein